MFRRIADRNIWLINVTILLVGMACGIAISLLALHLDDRGYEKSDIGSLAAWFALGIVVFSLPMDALIRRFSAKAVLVSALFLYALTVAVFPFATPWFELAALVRVFDGAASAGIWIGCETILLSRAGKDDKARVTSVYATAIAVGYMVGPFFSKAVVAASTITSAFLLAGVISAFTGVLVWWRLDPDVEPEQVAGEGSENGVGAKIASLVWQIKNSCFGNFAYGYFQASMVLFLPLYLIASKGITREQTIVIPGFFALGMLCFVNIAGRLGDRHGHLLIMRILGLVGTATVIGFVVLDQYWLMCTAVAVAGATLASISPISLALQGVTLAPAQYSQGNAIYNGFYAAGMLVGPPMSGALFKAFGGTAMLYHLAALWAAFVVFTMLFARDDPSHRAYAPPVLARS